LDQVKLYINTNNRRPSSQDKNEDIKKMGNWLSDQKKNYNIDIALCKKIMKNENIKISWEEFINDYKEYFESNEKVWFEKLDQVKLYMGTNCGRPSKHDKNEDIKRMGYWLSDQIKNYNIDIAKCKCIMKDINIKSCWEEFINDNKYKQYFESDENNWLKKLNQVKLYIDANRRRPTETDKDIKQIAKWLSHQKANYNIDITRCKGIMKNENIKSCWEEFIDNYKEYI
jgi:hypothetical protein